MKLALSSVLIIGALIASKTTLGDTLNHKTIVHTTDTTKTGLVITPLAESNDFPSAKLSIKNVKTEMLGIDSVKMMVNFDVTNYDLTKMTMDMNADDCANSEQGQHIHFIMDNKPYQALYKPENTVKLPVNSEHYLLCFLSRSYHLSVKSPDASLLIHFKIDENGKYVQLPTPTKPMLFYSRPKGEYAGKDTQNVLLDFYVKNAKIGPKDYKVKVNVADTTFTVDQWQPYFIKNAPMGNLKLKIQLLDAAGKEVSGPNTTVERSVTLKN
jgi:hypothetical protein